MIDGSLGPMVLKSFTVQQKSNSDERMKFFDVICSQDMRDLPQGPIGSFQIWKKTLVHI